MRIRKTYNNPVIELFEITEKARDDRFEPITVPSKKYKTWRAYLDMNTCFECADNHGRVFDIKDITVQLPPLHPRCRCKLKDMEAIEAGSATNNGLNGADIQLKHNGKLPDYYVSSTFLEELGWEQGARPSQFAPGKMLGGNTYSNRDGRLPVKPGRVWYEADINYTVGRRNLHRIVWSNDGLIFVTYDHYHTFYEIIQGVNFMKEAIIDLTDCKHLIEMHERIRVALNFPKGYGMNWDAFWDMINRDCEYDYIIVKGSSTVADELIGSVKKMRDALEENKRYWLDSKHPFNYEFID